MEQRAKESVDRQNEILEAMRARKGEKGKEYTDIVYQTAAALACIWEVKQSPAYTAIDEYLDYAGECLMIAGVWKAMEVPGAAVWKELCDEFQSDVLAIGRHIVVKGSDDEMGK